MNCTLRLKLPRQAQDAQTDVSKSLLLNLAGRPNGQRPITRTAGCFVLMYSATRPSQTDRQAGRHKDMQNDYFARSSGESGGAGDAEITTRAYAQKEECKYEILMRSSMKE